MSRTKSVKSSLVHFLALRDTFLTLLSSSKCPFFQDPYLRALLLSSFFKSAYLPLVDLLLD